jgi:hypothetical protein
MKPETELILLCVSPDLNGSRYRRALELSREPINWADLVRRTKQHGLASLFYHNLSRLELNISVEPLAELRSLVQCNAIATLRLTQELLDLSQNCRQQPLRFISYKGPALAQKLYGEPTLRQYIDLDVLVNPADVSVMSGILEKRGYENMFRLSPGQQRLFMQKDCEYAFINKEERFHLDLHWHFVPRYFAMRLDIGGFWQRAEEITLEGQQLLTLNNEDSLLILAINAAKDFWARLSALCDIAWLLPRIPETAWPALWAHATHARAQRMLGLSIWLARDLFGLRLPAFVEAKLAADKDLESLANVVKAHFESERPSPLAVNSFLLPARSLPTRLARWEFYTRLALEPSPEDWDFIHIPPPLEFLYYATRPFRLARKYLFSN